MVKNTSLSSDIDLIKEFEELKLKQKLLVGTLKRKDEYVENRFLLELNSKIDFLVKIFKEAKEIEETNANDGDISKVIGRIDTMESKLDELTKKIDKLNFSDLSINSSNQGYMAQNEIKSEYKSPLNINPNIDNSINADNKTHLDNGGVVLENSSKSHLDLKDKSLLNKPGEDDSILPPKPDFVVKMEDSLNNSKTDSSELLIATSDGSEKKKKKWL